MGMHGNVREPDGSLRLNRHGRPTIKTLLFPKNKATPIHDWDTLGLRGTASESYRLDNLFVPEDFAGTREDPTLRRDTGPCSPSPCKGFTPSESPRWRLGSRVPCSTLSSR